jgi:hypothetical protein
MSNRITEQPFCQTRVSGSALIADFLGWENYGDGKTYKFPNIYPIYNIDDEENTGWISEQISKAEFDTRWDWLMPVVDKLMRTKIGDGVEYVEYPYLRTFGMLNEETKNTMVRFNGFQVFEAETLIEATFLAVVDLLEWWSKADC